MMSVNLPNKVRYTSYLPSKAVHEGSSVQGRSSCELHCIDLCEVSTMRSNCYQ